MNAALLHLIEFSDSTALVLLLAQFDGLPSKIVERVFNKVTNFQWIPSPSGNEMADYLARKGKQLAKLVHVNCQFTLPN